MYLCSRACSRIYPPLNSDSVCLWETRNTEPKEEVDSGFFKYLGRALKGKRMPPARSRDRHYHLQMHLSVMGRPVWTLHGKNATWWERSETTTKWDGKWILPWNKGSREWPPAHHRFLSAECRLRILPPPHNWQMMTGSLLRHNLWRWLSYFLCFAFPIWHRKSAHWPQRHGI